MWLHRAPESVTLQRVPGNRFMCSPQLTQREFVSEQPVGIRLSEITEAEVIDGAVDNAGMVIGEVSRGPRRHEPGGLGEAGRQPIEPYDFDVRDGQHPAALVAMRVVEHVELAGMQSADVGFLAQRSVDRVGKCLTLVQKGARQRPASTGWAAHLQNHQPDVVIQRQHSGVDGDRRAHVVGEGASVAAAPSTGHSCRRPDLIDHI